MLTKIAERFDIDGRGAVVVLDQSPDNAQAGDALYRGTDRYEIIGVEESRPRWARPGLVLGLQPWLGPQKGDVVHFRTRIELADGSIRERVLGRFPVSWPHELLSMAEALEHAPPAVVSALADVARNAARRQHLNALSAAVRLTDALLSALNDELKGRV